MSDEEDNEGIALNKGSEKNKKRAKKSSAAPRAKYVLSIHFPSYHLKYETDKLFSIDLNAVDPLIRTMSLKKSKILK